MKIMNAFHKDYVKTYMPEFLSGIRSEEAARENGRVSGARNKATRESTNSGVFTISDFPKTKPVKVSLALKQYFTYSKAGAGNVKPRGKK
jgi:hypothetical protein